MYTNIIPVGPDRIPIIYYVVGSHFLLDWVQFQNESHIIMLRRYCLVNYYFIASRKRKKKLFGAPDVPDTGNVERPRTPR